MLLNQGEKMWDIYYKYLMDTYNIYRMRYSNLLFQLFNTPFAAVLIRDENRVSDGEDIRVRFFNHMGLSGSFNGHDVSILEVILALSDRVDREYTGNPLDPHPEIIFWELLGNLGVDKFDNNHYNSVEIDEILAIWINREFDFNGNGSLFPLKNPEEDQTCVELWGQCMAYLSENWV